MRPVKCWLGHKWVRRHYEDNESSDAFYWSCRRCGVERDYDPPPASSTFG